MDAVTGTRTGPPALKRTLLGALDAVHGPCEGAERLAGDRQDRRPLRRPGQSRSRASPATTTLMPWVNAWATKAVNTKSSFSSST